MPTTADNELLKVHRDLLERWRVTMNLVGPGPIEVHYEDARLALNGLAPTGRWVDLGTGAGFPGVVFAAMFPEVELELVDSRKKRCRFLDEVVALSGSAIKVRRMRHEDLEAAAYDGIMSRALASPDDMVKIGRRLLKPAGSLVLFLQRTAPVPKANDFEVFHVEHYDVDGKARTAATLRFTPT